MWLSDWTTTTGLADDRWILSRVKYKFSFLLLCGFMKIQCSFSSPCYALLTSPCCVIIQIALAAEPSSGLSFIFLPVVNDYLFFQLICLFTVFLKFSGLLGSWCSTGSFRSSLASFKAPCITLTTWTLPCASVSAFHAGGFQHVSGDP